MLKKYFFCFVILIFFKFFASSSIKNEQVTKNVPDWLYNTSFVADRKRKLSLANSLVKTSYENYILKSPDLETLTNRILLFKSMWYVMQDYLKKSNQRKTETKPNSLGEKFNANILDPELRNKIDEINSNLLNKFTRSNTSQTQNRGLVSGIISSVINTVVPGAGTIIDGISSIGGAVNDYVNSAPRGLRISDTQNTSFEFSWIEPEGSYGKDVIRFEFTLQPKPLHNLSKDDSCSIPNFEKIQLSTKDFNYIYSKAYPDFQYDISIWAISEKNGAGKAATISAKTKQGVSTSPLNLKLEYEKKTLHCKSNENYNVLSKFSFKLPCNTNGNIGHYLVQIIGFKYFDQALLPSVHETETKISSKEMDSSQRFYYKMLVNASFIYEHTVTAVGVTGIIGDKASMEKTKQSPDGCPDPPADLNFNVSSDIVKLTWPEPNVFYGKIVKYKLEVVAKSLHYLSPDPQCKNEEVSALTQDNILKQETEIPLYLFYDYRCRFRLWAATSAGWGLPFEKNIVFEPGESTQPINVNQKLLVASNHCNNTSYNTSFEIWWDLPCDTADKLDLFKIWVVGKLFVKEIMEPILYLETFDVKANPDIKNLKYYIKIGNFNASYSYFLNISAVGKSGIEGQPQDFYIRKTADGCPDPPTKVHFTNATSTTLNLSWDKEENYYGVVENYYVNITSFSTSHFVSKNKDCKLRTGFKKLYELPSMECELKDLLPHFKYSVDVWGKTSAGGGIRVNLSNITKSDVPEPVKQAKVTKNDLKLDIGVYELNTTLSFDPTCNSNGVFRHYLINGSGVRSKYPAHSFSFKLSKPRLSYAFLMDLKPEYEYSFEIYVVNSEFNSSAEVKYDAPTGVPPIDKNLFHTSLGANPSEICVTIEKNIFNEYFGTIKYWALYLVFGEFKPKPTIFYNFGTREDEWPDIKNTLKSDIGNVSSVVQITPDFWFPFEVESEDDDNPELDGNYDDFDFMKLNALAHYFRGLNESEMVEFFLGKTTDCKELDYCQKLKNNTYYMLIFRGITNSTFSDMYTLVKTEKPSFSWDLDVTWIAGIAGISLLSLFGLLLYYRKRKIRQARQRKRLRTEPRRISNAKIVICTDPFNEVMIEKPNVTGTAGGQMQTIENFNLFISIKEMGTVSHIFSDKAVLTQHKI